MVSSAGIAQAVVDYADSQKSLAAAKTIDFSGSRAAMKAPVGGMMQLIYSLDELGLANDERLRNLEKLRAALMGIYAGYMFYSSIKAVIMAQAAIEAAAAAGEAAILMATGVGAPLVAAASLSALATYALLTRSSETTLPISVASPGVSARQAVVQGMVRA